MARPSGLAGAGYRFETPRFQFLCLPLGFAVAQRPSALQFVRGPKAARGQLRAQRQLLTRGAGAQPYATPNEKSQVLGPWIFRLQDYVVKLSSGDDSEVAVSAE